jgi:two-component system response regulator HydG
MSGELRILVVDDDPDMVKTLVDIFRSRDYEAEPAHSGSEALRKVKEGHFDCVLSDVRMPNVDGLELYRAIKARQPNLPVVLMTAYAADRLVKEGLEEGAIACLTKPLDINALLSFFSSLRKERSVVIIDDDPQFCETLGGILRVRGFAVTQVVDPQGVIEMIGGDGQVVLLDMKLDGVSGLEILREIRARYPHLPVVLVTGYRDEMASAIEAALEIKAYTCLNKPIEMEELLQVLTQVRHRELGRILEHHG